MTQKLDPTESIEQIGAEPATVSGHTSNKPLPKDVRANRSWWRFLRPRFSLRTMMVVITIVCIVMPTWILPSVRQYQAAKQIEARVGGWAFAGDDRIDPGTHSWYEHFYRNIATIQIETLFPISISANPSLDFNSLHHLRQIRFRRRQLWSVEPFVNDEQSVADYILSTIPCPEKIHTLETGDWLVTKNGCDCIRKMNALENLDLENNGHDVDDLFLSQLGQLKELKSLKISIYINQTPATTDVQLTTSDPQVTAEGIRSVSTLPKLTRLHLKVNGYIKSVDFLQPLEQCTGLTELSFAYGRGCDEAVSYIHRLPNLEKLDLSSSDASPASIGLLNNLPRLKKLNLRQTDIKFPSGLKDSIKVQY
jgi:hypothetical protein